MDQDETKGFGGILMKSIDDALAVFDESVRLSVYYYLEKDHNLTRQQIALRPDLFDQAITKMFGPQGAGTIKILALKRLYEAVGERRTPSKDFAGEVRKLKMKSVLSETTGRGDKFA